MFSLFNNRVEKSFHQLIRGHEIRTATDAMPLQRNTFESTTDLAPMSTNIYFSPSPHSRPIALFQAVATASPARRDTRAPPSLSGMVNTILSSPILYRTLVSLDVTAANIKQARVVVFGTQGGEERSSVGPLLNRTQREAGVNSTAGQSVDPC